MKINCLSICVVVLLIGAMFSCKPSASDREDIRRSISSKPYARYWWFASEMKVEDIRDNLDWLKANGFGGVELAWVYPYNAFDQSDSMIHPRQKWLSKEWSAIVAFTVRYADSIGLGCDMTLGTLWPFGDSKVSPQEATRRFGDSTWRQILRYSWEHPIKGYVVDHLTPKYYLPYFDRMAHAFPMDTTKLPGALFIDSWEVETKGLWTESFAKDFQDAFGYDISTAMDSLYEPGYEGFLFDYMSLISDKVVKFYSDFDSLANAYGKLSRGQVSGAPCDLLYGYTFLDIPEGESMLFEPEFSVIPASAALFSGVPLVSAESFTCIYGWPRDHRGEEQLADIKLVADALMANGVNHFIWHGKPHQPAGMDTARFYATTHVGQSSPFSDQLLSFNNYLEKISGILRKGKTWSDIAVYLPLEDAWRAGVMPIEQQFKWAWGHYEMRYASFSDELAGYRPTWISASILENCTVQNGRLICGSASYPALYMNVDYVDYDALRILGDMLSDGLRVIWKKIPEYPGRFPPEDYNLLVKKLLVHPNALSGIPDNMTPLIEGDHLPPYWVRQNEDSLFVFMAPPKAADLSFPLEYGQSLTTDTAHLPVRFRFRDIDTSLNLRFTPYQSLLYQVTPQGISSIDIYFLPSVPATRSKDTTVIPPWLVGNSGS